MQEPLLSVSYSILPNKGEDSFVLRSYEHGAFLCVADGCGGLGSRRYKNLAGRTGAHLASRLITRAFCGWAEERRPMPLTPEEGELLCRELEHDLQDILCGFAKRNCENTASRIVGSMQRCLPTTLCAVITQEGAASWRDLCFLWAGDSRGYVLDENGLHQCTRDDLRGNPDAFDSLYRDVPLSNLLSADHPIKLSMRRLRAPLPCMALAVTDGAYGCLSTPMEYEMLLMNTLRSATSYESWVRKLTNALKKLAHDDATILCQPCGFGSFTSMKQHLLPRREALQKTYITPVRRRAHNITFARDKWLAYQTQYDWTAGGKHERADWRI